jgi:hypothetical protein
LESGTKMINVKRSPANSLVTLDVSSDSDVLTINGEAFDFSALEEGGKIEAVDVPSEYIISDVTRINGVVELTMVAPYLGEGTQEERFPTPYTPPSGVRGKPVVLDPSKIKTKNQLINESQISVRQAAELLAEEGKITWDEAITWSAGQGVPAASTSTGKAKFDLAKADIIRLDHQVFSDIGVNPSQLKTLMSNKSKRP